jgi:hypothetical protein
MVKGQWYGLTKQDTKVNGSSIKHVEKGNSSILTEIFTMVNG